MGQFCWYSNYGLSEFNSQKGQEILSSQPLGAIQWVLEAVSPEAELTTHLHPVPRLRMYGATGINPPYHQYSHMIDNPEQMAGAEPCLFMCNW